MTFVKRPIAAVRRGLGVVTTLGWTVVAIGVVAWMTGVLLGWRELLVVAGSCALLSLSALLFTLGSVHLSAELEVEPARVTVGERAAGSLTFHNQSKGHSRAVEVELPVGTAAAVFRIPRLAGGAGHEELFVVPTTRRAIIPVGPVTTVQGDPLGLMRRTRTWSDRYEIFVHPLTTGTDTLAAGLLRDLEGQQTKHLSNSDIAFHTLRDYVVGDDRRHVHWKTSAKLDRLLVRQYVDTRRSHIAVLLSCDANEYADEDEFELAVSCATSVATQAIRDEATLTFIVGDEELPVQNPRRLLDRISGLELTAGENGLDRTMIKARRAAEHASIAVVSIGSVPSLIDVRRSASRLSHDTIAAVIRCDEAGVSGYTIIGSGRFVSVPRLDRLRPGLKAVLA